MSGATLAALLDVLTALGAVGGGAGLLGTWRQSRRNGRLLTGEDTVESDDGLLGQTEEQNRRLRAVEEDLERHDRALRRTDALPLTDGGPEK